MSAESCELQHFIAGAYQASGGDARIQVHSPATREHLGSVPNGTPADVSAAVAAASEAFPAWGALDALERGRLLSAVGERLAERLGEFVEMESAVTGRPVREMRAQIARLPEWFHYFGGLAKSLQGDVIPFKGDYLNYTQHVPYGVVGLITPWNHPLLIFVKKLAAALAAGNCVVAKPSELAPLSPLRFAELAHEAGLPAGVLNIVTGDHVAGGALCEAPEVRHLDLTGGTETGRKVAGIAAQRLVPSTLELGGNAPVVIFGDTPLDEAVAASAFAAFVASGQTCISGSRFLVEGTLYDEFVDAFARKADGLRLGHPGDESTDMGPLISQAQLERALEYIDIGRREGARIAAGGTRPDLPPELTDGFYLRPTVFADARPEMRVVREEIFGPVVSVQRFSDEAEAIRLANDSPFGLGASVWTRDIGRGHRVAAAIRAGMVWVNDHHKNDPASPWGGFGDSGYGKENGWDALVSYMQKQSVVVRLAPDFPDWFANEESSRYG